MNINPNKLLTHPFNTVVYGMETSDPGLLESIRTHGIQQPIDVVNTTHDGKVGIYILSGHRRVAAARELSIAGVPVRLLPDQGTLWQQSFLLESNRQREKNAEQKAREHQELTRIELVLAEQRREAGKPDIVNASDVAATKLGLDTTWARRMEVITKAADEGNPEAIAALVEINAGRATPSTAYRELFPREEAPVSFVGYRKIAEELREVVGFFDVAYSPRTKKPQHGFVFKTRFVCEEEARAFARLLTFIPREEIDKFALQSKNWRA